VRFPFLPAPIPSLALVTVLGATGLPAKDTAWASFPLLGNEKFSNGRNWNGGVPANTDNVLFPSYATPRNLDNDLVENDADGFVGLQTQIALHRITGSSSIEISANLINTAQNGGVVEILDPGGLNTFESPISIRENAILRVFQPTGLGSTAGSTVIYGRGQLHIAANGGPLFLDEPLFFDGGELKTASTGGLTAGLLTIRSQVSHFGPSFWRMGSPITITGRILGSNAMVRWISTAPAS
jgi:hypothetical protein